jgi:hypothetical protein
VFVVATLAMTWPLASGLSRDVPFDFGDSLFNCWVLGWNADSFLRFLGGDLGAFNGYLHGNIFHPDPYALAYSEFLFPQTLVILPVYAVTKNLILCYNLLFLSTFVLSALGMYLLVRELTGNDWAALVAGLIFGFLPYRADQATHMQVLSSQWMPFAILGLRQYFVTGRRWPLVGAVGAIVLQNLSCGYYILYFGLFLPVYVLLEMTVRGLLKNWRTWRDMVAAGAVVAACTVPFLIPYLELNKLTGHHRTIEEITSFSADILGYATVNENVRLWGGWLQAFPRPEGQLFPGATVTVLAVIACIAAVRRARRGVAGAMGAVPPGLPPWAIRWRRPVVVLAAIVAAFSAVLWVRWALGLTPRLDVGLFVVRFRDVSRLIAVSAVATAVVLFLSPRTRATLRAAAGRYEVWFTGAALVAAYLSLGPTPTLGGLPTRLPGAYGWLFEYAPGFGGLRVPARMVMVALMFLSVAGGAGAAVLLSRSRRQAWWGLGLAAMILIESTAAPIEMNRVNRYTDLLPPPASIAIGNQPPVEYEYIAGLPEGTVLVEFPFGDIGWDIRAVYNSTLHWKPLVNGFSGGSPPRYVELARVLFNVNAEPERAWRVLRETGPTHALVHLDAFRQSRASPEAWLIARGARLAFVSPGIRVYELPPPAR